LNTNTVLDNKSDSLILICLVHV